MTSLHILGCTAGFAHPSPERADAEREGPVAQKACGIAGEIENQGDVGFHSGPIYSTHVFLYRISRF